MKRKLLGLVIAGSVFVYGCLPGDIRPEPGRVFVTAEASSMTVEGFSTDDGWAIQFDRMLVGLGDIALVADPCANYANAGYDRLFNFTLPGAQKLGEVYGLGGCEIQFRLRPPSADSLLENGVTSADRDFMRALNGLESLPTDGPPPRTAVYARGVAKRGNETKRFEWKFVARYALSDCAAGPGTEATSFLHLNGGDDLHPKIVFHAEDLFRAGIEEGAALRFDSVADADANADGDITLAELFDVPAPVTVMDGGIEDAGAGDAGVSGLGGVGGLAGFMTLELLPRLVYFEGSRCQRLPQGQGRGGGGFL